MLPGEESLAGYKNCSTGCRIIDVLCAALSPAWQSNCVVTRCGIEFPSCSGPCRLVTVASGAAAGKFLQYEAGGAGVSVQTAYGVEVEVFDGR